MKKIKYLSFLIFLFLTFKADVSAGTLSIWASASNVSVGQTVTISVKASNLAGTFDVTSSNQGVLAGGVNGSWLENNTYTYQFTAKSVGKATITATAINVGDFDTNGDFKGSKSVTLNIIEKKSSSSGGSTVTEKKEYSSDNTLSSLSVDGYELTPTFSKDTVEYRLTVDESVEKITVTAKANHEKASVNGAGEIQLAGGENTVEVKVIAENGNEKIYKIIVTVEDQHPIKVNIGKKEFTIVKKNNGLLDKLDYYEESIIKIDNQDVVAYTNAKTGVTLVLLKDKDNKIGYYIYHKEDNTYTEYHFITINGVALQLIDAPNFLEYYQKYAITIQEQAVDIYKIKKTHKVGLIYGTNLKTGNTSYYVYDQNEETLSKYFDEEVKVYKSEIDNLKKYLMIFMGIVSFLAIIFLIISIWHGKKKKKKILRVK